MKSRRPMLALLTAVLLAGAGITFAQQDTQGAAGSADGARPDRAARADVDRKDRKFIEKAAMDGITEVELGRLAQARAESEQVRQFGAQMQQDHGKANSELMQIAQSKGITLPTEADRKAQKKVRDLGEHQGAEFDRRYVAEMVKEHQKDLKLFQDRAENSKDPQIQAFAQKGAQTISGHLQHVRQLSASLEGSRTGAAADASRATNGPQTSQRQQ